MKIDKNEVTRRMNRFTDVCRRTGAKLTHQRLEIYREVAQTVDHPDVDAVYRRVRKKMPTISLDTVYRTLWWLKDLGLVRTLGPPRGRSRFDANLDRHHHFVCTRCGSTQDIISDVLDGLNVTDSLQSVGSVKTIQLEVKGICNHCDDKKDEPLERYPSDRITNN